jgi:hypothetical protein
MSSSILITTVDDDDDDERFAFRFSRWRRRFSDERSTARVIVGDTLRFNDVIVCCLEFFDDTRVDVVAVNKNCPTETDFVSFV